MVKQLEQIEFDFRKDYERSLRKEEVGRLWKNIFKPSLIFSSVIIPIYFVADSLSKHPEYIQATKEFIKSIF